MSRFALRSAAGSAALAALLSSVAPAALAQATGEARDAAAVADAGSPVGLAEVTVTARRREENVQDVPIAVSVTTGEQLADTGVSSILQLTQLVPTLQVLSPNPRNTALTIRGLGASYGLANDGLEQGVGVYVDQVYNSRPASATLDFIDIQQIEVLRGPQGTLFGKNTTAGALNVTTRDASQAFEAQFEGTVGTYDYRQVKGTVSGPIVQDKVAARLSYVGTWRDGTIYNPVQQKDQNAVNNQALRAQILLTPTQALTIRLNADYSWQQPECCTQLYYTVGTTLKPANQQYPALAAGRNYRPPSTNPYDRKAVIDDLIQADQWLSGLSAIVDYDLGFATLTGVAAHREWDWEPRNDRDYTALDVTRRSNNPSHQKQDSLELRLASSGASRVDWTVGLYYFDQNVTTNGVTEYGSDASYWLLPATNTPAALLEGYTVFNDSTIDTTSYAVFGQLTWNVTERLKITPGLRYTDEKKDGAYAQRVTGGLATTDATLISRRNGIARPQAFSAETDDGSLSGQIAVSYEVSDTLNVYASYSRGHKSGGINMTALPLTAQNVPAQEAAVIDPEKVTTYEAGVKSQLFDRLLTANLAVFATDVKDFQANVVDSGPGALRGYLANVEKVTVRGAELDLATRRIGGFSGYFNFAYTDAKYDDFKNGPCPLERVGTSTAACDLSGRQLPGVSKWAGAFGADYRRESALLGGGEFYLGVDASFRSSYFADATTSIYTRLKAQQIVNFRAGFESETGWEGFVSLKNAFDEKYMQNLTVVSGNSGLVVGTPGDDRTISFTLRGRY
ncbi:TonB-dependent receptor [Phenylobacterium sp. J426]|uniref:TonB-dependent receptor n=1 Tax=Phenylobacterium sp. J426 TaxID=2898439 RepID=UPI0021516A0F|nr:TonB-dependent receptor [Phenylobacterium sp. J426]MCR5875224.1 TonB-dependent receptor [Phenylobacterium sp. J426]